MKNNEHILILGLGGIGYYLAKRLTHDGYAVTAIESDPDLVRRASGDIDARLVLGNALNFACWRDIEDERMDYLIAVTDNDAVNILASQIADKCGIRRKIARVRELSIWEPGALLNQRDLEIDLVIRPGELAAQEIARLLKRRAGNTVIDIADGEMQVTSTPVGERSALAHMRLREFGKAHPDLNIRVVAIARGIHTFIPSGEDEILPMDHVFILAHARDLERVLSLAGVVTEKRHRVMIVGGGLIGRRVAALLQDDFPVCVIEQDERRAEQLSVDLPRAECLHGDGGDAEALIQAGLLHTDTIITATGDNETNIMTSVLAKHLIADRGDEEHRGRGRTIALVKKEGYVALASSMGADIVLNAKSFAGNEILRYLRRGELLSVAQLHGCDAEVLEFVTEPDAPITRGPLAQVEGITDKVIIGAACHEGHWQIAVGSTEVRPGDRVVGICKPDHVPALQALFHS